MKKKNHIYTLFLVFIISCNAKTKEINQENTNKKQDTTVSQKLNPEELIYDHAGTYIERYPNGQVKKEGNKNANGKRHGYWVAYSENGVKMSEITYSDGKEHGIHIVYYPNTNYNYIGEWKMGKKVGKWKFYNQEGTLVKTVDFDKK